MILHDETSKVQSGALSGLSGSSVIGAPPVVKFGTPEQKNRWLPGIFTGEIRFCLGATEPTGGSDLANLKTTAKKSADGRFYIVNGHKVRLSAVAPLIYVSLALTGEQKWITGAMTATHMTAPVRTGGPGAAGISALVIPTNLPGFSARKIDNSGLNAGGKQSWDTGESLINVAQF